MKFEIDAELAQEILDYLKSKPYEDVAALIGKLVQLQPVALCEREDKDADTGSSDS